MAIPWAAIATTAVSYLQSRKAKKKKGNETSTGTSERTASANQTTTKKGSKGTSETGFAETQSSTSSLDKNFQKQLQGLADGLINSGNAQQNQQQLSQLSTALTNINSVDIEPIVAQARREGEDELAKQVTELSSSVGSSQNTIVQDLAARGRADLEGELAATQSQLLFEQNNQKLDLITQSMEALTGASGSNIGQINSIAQTLKGSTVNQTGTTSEQKQLDEISSLTEILKSLVQDTTKTTGNVAQIGKTRTPFEIDPGIFKGWGDKAGSSDTASTIADSTTN